MGSPRFDQRTMHAAVPLPNGTLAQPISTNVPVTVESAAMTGKENKRIHALATSLRRLVRMLIVFVLHCRDVKVRFRP